MILIVKHIPIEGPGTVSRFLEEEGFNVKVIELSEEKLPPFDPGKTEAVVVLGGPMNVYEEDKYPFLREEDVFIKEVLENGIPYLGICLGAQLLAKALEAPVSSARQKEIGWYEMDLTTCGRMDALFRDIETGFPVFQWHEDTFQLPRKAVLLATSEACKNQAFRWGNNAYGVQFHFEIGGDMIRDWVKEYFEDTEDFLRRKRRQMLLEYYRIEDDFLKRSRKICMNFKKVIKASKRS